MGRRGREDSHKEDNSNYFLYIQDGICYLFASFFVLMLLKKKKKLILDQKYGVLSQFLE